MTEQREDKRPGIADLKDSGSLEQDADVVVLMYRDSYYIERSSAYLKGEPEAVVRANEARNEIEAIVAKNRIGATRSHKLWCRRVLLHHRRPGTRWPVTAPDLPAPLVPAEVDLRDFTFLPLDVVRLRDSDLAALSSGDGFRAAVLLWCTSWHQSPAASLPDDDRLLARYAGFGRDIDAWKAVRDEALRGYRLCSGWAALPPLARREGQRGLGVEAGPESADRSGHRGEGQRWIVTTRR